MSIESGSDFLKQKYDLHTKPEVESAADRTNVRNELQAEEGEELETVGPDPHARIENYLHRFTEIIERDDPDKRRQGVNALKHVLHNKFVVKPDEIPQKYWENQRQMARNLGHGDIEITEEMREQGADIIVADQASSLNKWVDYLASDDATYPMWLKYYAVRGILGMSTYDKERHVFGKRDKGTTAPFPDLDREALAYVLDAVEKRQSPEYFELNQQLRTAKNELKRLRGEQRQLAKSEEESDVTELTEQIEQAEARVTELSNAQEQVVSGSLRVEDEAKQELHTLLQESDFAKLYAWAIEKVTPAEQNELLITEGEWVKYEQGTDHMSLVESLQGHGTGWCTAGESMAKTQLEAGDFYVYYSLDKNGNATVPRAAIRMENDTISEVRGIAPEQNLDPYIADVVREKVQQFPDGALYEKKAYDMQMLTYIERKMKAGDELDKDDLKFLYEIDSRIEGFGYERDPRIDELRAQRNPVEDAPIVLECEPQQIAYSIEEVSENTKAYIGPLIKDIFNILPKHIEHIYTFFPERKIMQREIKTGNKSADELERELLMQHYNLLRQTRKMLEILPIAVSEVTKSHSIIMLDLGTLQGDDPNAHILRVGKAKPTYQEIFSHAEELGLKLCPPELGPHLRLDYSRDDQPIGQSLTIAMKPVEGNLFTLWHFVENMAQLGCMDYTTKDGIWSDEYFVFCRQ